MTMKQLAEQMILKYPDSNNMQIVRLLMKEYTQLFVTIEATRSAVRSARGANGKEQRKSKNPDIPERTAEQIENARNNYFIPDSDPTDFKIIKLPKNIKKWLILGDLHIPYHSKQAIEITIKFSKEQGCDGIIYNGDIIDCYQLSKFEKDPTKRTFKSELEMTKEIIGIINNYIQPKAWYFKEGNHEKRLISFLLHRAPELFDMPQFSMSEFLKIEANGGIYVHNTNPITYNNLSILHGHELGGASSAVNPARGLFLKSLECTAENHYHRNSEHVEPTLTGKVIETWSIGCLCDLRPDYAPFNKWNHGFAILEASGENWKMKLFKIVKGEIF